MARNWTSDQQKVIELHNRNILVSAAAGSGKTAVLVERIIQMVTDDTRNIDIDRLVVVTFTKAAAGEMKQRISDAIEEKIEAEPDNDRLQRQLTLINNAQITTIDSFCLGIVRNYFVDANIDPGFRTADEGELKLLETEVLGNIIEEYYGSERKEFFDFVESYGTGRDDSAIEDIIKRLYRFSRSYPWPIEWLLSCRNAYEIDDMEQLDENESIKYLTGYVKSIICDYDVKYNHLEEICSEPDGPDMYTPMIMSDHMNIGQLMQCETYEQLGQAIGGITFDRLSSKKSDTVDTDKKEYVKSVRDKYKKTIQTISRKIFAQTAQENLVDIQKNRQSINMMVELAIRFYNDMQDAKRDKNIIDFNDMEHLALDILVKKEGEEICYTPVADSLSEFYEEILIDEYQDSNYLQEAILYSISRGRINEENNNLFMVGDVKQSIYKFRLARPDIFTDKYNTYTLEEGRYQKIELSKNFRSRGNVLDTINDVFFNIMKPYVGGIDYNSNVMLNTGLEFADPGSDEVRQRLAGDTEVIIIDSKPSDDENTDSQDTETVAERELEALTIAHTIKKFTDEESGMMIYDSGKKIYRTAKYSDIVILTRTVSGWADIFVNTLMNKDIPAYADTSSGYFNTREIKLLLSVLAIIDNPLQDIPLAAVLTSYFGRITAEELADMRRNDKNVRLYTTIRNYSENNVLFDKVAIFLEKLDICRKISEYTSIHDLIWKIVYDTGFYDYVGSMPAGRRRQANVDMLMEKAKSFENTSYTGLFNFLKYIEKLQKYDVDYGEATVLGENENLVRVMSIHKSKGLEFPIVVLAGMSKKFNNMDSNNSVVIDADLGIGATIVDLIRRTKNPTIIKNAIGYKLKMDNLSEELRILYVAMTRAKEKLVMTGTVKNIEKSMAGWQQMSMPYSFADLEGCSNYFDLVVPTALRLVGNTGKFRIETIMSETLTDMMRTGESCTETCDADADSNEDGTINAELPELPDYPYPDVSDMKAKITVSELKKMQHDEDTSELYASEQFVREAEMEDVIIPRFISGQQEMRGNERGSAYHRVMECLNYSQLDSLSDVDKDMQSMLDSRKITREQFEVVDSSKIYNFCISDIGKRVKMAYINGNLKREQPFVFGVDRENSQVQLVQGVVDLYLIEDNRITIVDYKTDNVDLITGSQELIKRYKIQLDYYGEALEKLLAMDVSEKIIYSFKLDEAITV